MVQVGADVWQGKPVLPMDQNDLAHRLATESIKSIYQRVWLDFMPGADVGTVQENKEWRGPRSFVAFVQIFSDKTATTLRKQWNAYVFVHAVLLNCSARFRRRLNEGF